MPPSRCERDPRYFEIACHRIEQAQRQGDMFVQSAPSPTPTQIELI
jgi:hypothetical protein